jgi:hypothetical protein
MWAKQGDNVDKMWVKQWDLQGYGDFMGIPWESLRKWRF